MIDQDHTATLAAMEATLEREISWADANYDTRANAARIVAKLRDTDPGLLAAWLDANAEQLVWQAITCLDNRTRPARAAGRSAFAKAVQASEGGDTSAMTEWLDDHRDRLNAQLRQGASASHE